MTPSEPASKPKVYMNHYGRRKGSLTCARTGKIAFVGRESAVNRLEELRSKSTVRRVYKCPSCKHWHLTSDQNRKRRVKQREKFNDGNVQSKRVSKHDDDSEFRKKIESLYAQQLGLV